MATYPDQNKLNYMAGRPIPRIPQPPMQENAFAKRRRAQLMGRMEAAGKPMGGLFSPMSYSPFSAQRAAAVAARDLGTDFEQELPNFTAQDAGDYAMQKAAPNFIQKRMNMMDTESQLPWKQEENRMSMFKDTMGLQREGMAQDERIANRKIGVAEQELQDQYNMGMRRILSNENITEADRQEQARQFNEQSKQRWQQLKMSQEAQDRTLNMAESGQEFSQGMAEKSFDASRADELWKQGLISEQAKHDIEMGNRTMTLAEKQAYDQMKRAGETQRLQEKGLDYGHSENMYGLGTQRYQTKTNRALGYGQQQLSRDLGMGQLGVQREGINADREKNLLYSQVQREGLRNSLLRDERAHDIELRKIDMAIGLAADEKAAAKHQIRIDQAVQQLDKFTDPSIAELIDPANSFFNRTFDATSVNNLKTTKDVIQRSLNNLEMQDPELARTYRIRLTESIGPVVEGIATPSFNRAWNSSFLLGGTWNPAAKGHLSEAVKVANEIKQMLMTE